MKGFEIVEATDVHLVELRDFMRRAYRADYVFVRNDALFQWQFGERGASRGPVRRYHMLLGCLGGAIVGCLGFIPVSWRFRGERLAGAWTANWMVDPDRRRLGVGPLLLRALAERCEVTASLGLGDDAKAILPRMGFQDIGELERFVAVLDGEGAAALMPSETMTWRDVAAPIGDPHFQGGEFVARRVSRFDAGIDGLWQRVPGDLSGTDRDKDYLNWRYAEHPVFLYRLFVAEEGSACRGFAVSRIETVLGRSTRVARLVECFGETPGATGVLIAAVLADSRDEGAVLIDYFASTRRHAEVLEQHGLLGGADRDVHGLPMLFQPLDYRRTGMTLMVRPPSGAAVDGALWYVTRGDGDQDRPN